MARTPRAQRNTVISNFSTPEIPAGQGWAALADLSQHIGEVVRPAAIKAAREEGATATYRDENGVLRVNEKSLLGGEMAAEHNQAAMASYLSQQRVDLREATQEFRLQHENDPGAFQESMKAYKKQTLDGAPKLLRADVAASIDEAALETANGMQLKLLSKNREQAKRNTMVERKLTRQDAVNLFIENRGEVTPEFQAKMNEAIDQTRLLVEMGVESPADLELQARTIMETAEKEWQARLETEFDESLKIIRAGGIPRNEDELLKDVEGTPLEETLTTAIAARELRPTFGRMSPTEQQATLDEVRAMPHTPELQQTIDEFESIHDDTLEAVQEDGIAAAADRGEQVGEIDLTDPRTMAQRTQVAKALHERGFNPDGRFFKDDENAQISEQIQNASPEDKAVIAGNLIQGFGGASARAINELNVKGVFGHGAQLIASGADPRSVQLMFSGESMERPPRPDKATREEAAPEVLGPMAEAFPPEIFAALAPKVREAADAYFAARAGTVQEDEHPDLYKEALQAALGASNGRGGIREVNGFQTYLPPKVGPAQADRALDKAFSILPAQGDREVRPGPAVGPRVDLTPAQLEAAQQRFNALMSDPTVSISGGAPMNGRDPVSGDDLDAVKLVAVNEGVYEVHVERADGFVHLTDSTDGGPYLMSLSGLIRRSR